MYTFHLCGHRSQLLSSVEDVKKAEQTICSFCQQAEQHKNSVKKLDRVVGKAISQRRKATPAIKKNVRSSRLSVEE